MLLRTLVLSLLLTLLALAHPAAAWPPDHEECTARLSGPLAPGVEGDLAACVLYHYSEPGYRADEPLWSGGAIDGHVAGSWLHADQETRVAERETPTSRQWVEDVEVEAWLVTADGDTAWVVFGVYHDERAGADGAEASQGAGAYLYAWTPDGGSPWADAWAYEMHQDGACVNDVWAGADLAPLPAQDVRHAAPCAVEMPNHEALP